MPLWHRVFEYLLGPPATPHVAAPPPIELAPGTPVFISYSRVDGGIGQELYLFLQACEVRPWIDVADISAGDAWRAALDRAVRGAELVIVLLSRFAVQSIWTRAEWAAARAANRPIAVWLIDNCEVPSELRAFPLVDMRVDPLDEDHWVAALGNPGRSENVRHPLPAVRPDYVTRYGRTTLLATVLGVCIVVGIVLAARTGRDLTTNANDSNAEALVIFGALTLVACMDAVLLIHRLRTRTLVFREYFFYARVGLHEFVVLLGAVLLAEAWLGHHAVLVLVGVLGAAVTAAIVWLFAFDMRRPHGSQRVFQMLVRPYLGATRRPSRSGVVARSLNRTTRSRGAVVMSSPLPRWCAAYRYRGPRADDSPPLWTGGELADVRRLAVVGVQRDRRLVIAIAGASKSSATIVSSVDELRDLQADDVALGVVLTRFSAPLLDRAVRAGAVDVARTVVVIVERGCSPPPELLHVQPVDATELELGPVARDLAARLMGSRPAWEGSRDQRSELFAVPTSVLTSQATMVAMLAVSSPAAYADANMSSASRIVLTATLAVAAASAVLFILRRASAVAVAIAAIASAVIGLAGYPGAENPGAYRWGFLFTVGFGGLALSNRHDWETGDVAGLWGAPGPVSRWIVVTAIALAVVGGAAQLIPA